MVQAAVTGEKMLAELGQQFVIYPNQITVLKSQLVVREPFAFDGDALANPVVRVYFSVPLCPTLAGYLFSSC